MANLLGRSGTASPFPSSETVGTSIPDPKVGSRWFDGSNNEYVVVDCQHAFVAGEWVTIDHDHLASRLALDTPGRVGIVVAAVSASDTKAYVQIYGLYEGAAGTSNVATSKYMGIPSGTSDIGVATGYASSDAGGIPIFNAYAVTAPDSGATSAYATSFVSAGSSTTTYIGFKVWLNYPYTVGTSFSGATS